MKTLISDHHAEKQLAVFVNHLALGQLETCRAMLRAGSIPENDEAFLDLLAAAVIRNRHVMADTQRCIVNSGFRVVSSSLLPSASHLMSPLLHDSDIRAHTKRILDDALQEGRLSCEEEVEEVTSNATVAPATAIAVSIGALTLAVASARADHLQARRAQITIEQACDFILEHDGDLNALPFSHFLTIYALLARLLEEEEVLRTSASELDFTGDDAQGAVENVSITGDSFTSKGRGSVDDLTVAAAAVAKRSTCVPAHRAAWVMCESALRALWLQARGFTSAKSYLAFFNCVSEGDARQTWLVDDVFGADGRHYSEGDGDAPASDPALSLISLALDGAAKAHLLSIFYPPPRGDFSSEQEAESALRVDLFLMDSTKSEAAHVAVVDALLPYTHLHRFLDFFIDHCDSFNPAVANAAVLVAPPPLALVTSPKTPGGAHHSSPTQAQQQQQRQHVGEWAQYVRSLLAHRDADFLSLIVSTVASLLTKQPASPTRTSPNSARGFPGDRRTQLAEHRASSSTTTSHGPGGIGTSSATSSSFFSLVKGFLDNAPLTPLRPFVCFELYGMETRRRHLFTSIHAMTFDDHVLLIDFLTAASPSGDRHASHDPRPHPCAAFISFLNTCVKITAFLIRCGATSRPANAVTDPGAAVLLTLIESNLDVLQFVFSEDRASPTVSGTLDSPLASTQSSHFGTPPLSRGSSSTALKAEVRSSQHGSTSATASPAPSARTSAVAFIQGVIALLVAARQQQESLPASTDASVVAQVRFLRAIILVQYVVEKFASNMEAPAAISDAALVTLAELAIGFVAAFSPPADRQSSLSETDFCDVVVNSAVIIASTRVFEAVPQDTDGHRSSVVTMGNLSRLLQVLLEHVQGVVSAACVSSLRDISFRVLQVLQSSQQGVTATSTVAAASSSGGAVTPQAAGSSTNATPRSARKPLALPRNVESLPQQVSLPLASQTVRIADPLAESPSALLLSAVENGDFARAEQVLLNLFMLSEQRGCNEGCYIDPVLMFTVLARHLAALRVGTITPKQFEDGVGQLLVSDDVDGFPMTIADGFFSVLEADEDAMKVGCKWITGFRLGSGHDEQGKQRSGFAASGSANALGDIPIIAEQCATASEVFSRYMHLALEPKASRDVVARIVSSIERARRISKSSQATVEELDNILGFLRDVDDGIWRPTIVSSSTTLPEARFNAIPVALQFLRDTASTLSQSTQLEASTGSSSSSTTQVAFLLSNAAAALFEGIASGTITTEGAALDQQAIARILLDQYVLNHGRGRVVSNSGGGGCACSTLTPEQEVRVLTHLAAHIGPVGATLLLFAVCHDPLKVPFAPPECVWLSSWLKQRLLLARVLSCSELWAPPPLARSNVVAAAFAPSALQHAVDALLLRMEVGAAHHWLIRVLGVSVIPSLRRIFPDVAQRAEVTAVVIECLLVFLRDSGPAAPEPHTVGGAVLAELVAGEQLQGCTREAAIDLVVALLMEIPPWPQRAAFIINMPSELGSSGAAYSSGWQKMAANVLPHKSQLALVKSLMVLPVSAFASEQEHRSVVRAAGQVAEQLSKAEDLMHAIRALPGAHIPQLLRTDPLPLAGLEPLTVVAIADELVASAHDAVAIQFLSVVLRCGAPARSRDPGIVQALVKLHLQRLTVLQVASGPKRRDPGLCIVQYVHQVLLDEFGETRDSGEPFVNVSRARGSESSTVTVQVVEGLIDAVGTAEPNCEASSSVQHSLQATPWSLIARVLRYCHTSPLIAPLFVGDPHWQHALVGVQALITLERIIDIRGDEDGQLKVLLDPAFICHPLLLVENLIASQRVVEAAKIISDVPALQADQTLARVIAQYAKAACDVSAYDLYDEDEFPNGKTKGASLECALQRPSPLAPGPVGVLVDPSMDPSELRRVRGEHRFCNAPNIPFCCLLLNLLPDREFAAAEAFEIAAQMFETLGEYDSDVTKSVVIQTAESVLHAVNPNGEREMALQKKFLISRHLVVCGWKEHPQHADLDSQDGVIRLIGHLLAASQAKAAFSIADACGMDIGAVESLWVDHAVQLLRLGLFDEALDAASHLKSERVQREVFDVAIKIPVAFGYAAVSSGGGQQLSVRKMAPEAGHEVLASRRQGFQTLVQTFGDVQDLLSFHVRCGAMDNAVALLMHHGSSLADGAFIECVFQPCRKMRAEGLLRDAMHRYDPTLVSLRALLMQIGKFLEGIRCFSDLLVWQQWMCDYARAAHTSTMLALEEKTLPKKLHYLQLAEKMYVEAKFQPVQKKGLPSGSSVVTTNTSETGVVLPPTRLDSERLQNALVQCRLQAELCTQLHTEKLDFNKYSLYGDMDDVTRVIIELMTGPSAKNLCSLALQISAAFRLSLNATAGVACKRLISAKKTDSADIIVDSIRRSIALSLEEKNALVLDVIRSCVADQKNPSKSLKWADQLAHQMTPEGGHHVHALLVLRRFKEAEAEAVKLRSAELVNAVFHEATNAQPQTAVTQQVAESTQTYLARYGMQ